MDKLNGYVNYHVSDLGSGIYEVTQILPTGACISLGVFMSRDQAMLYVSRLLSREQATMRFPDGIEFRN
jgi:hypothetical protein